MMIGVQPEPPILFENLTSLKVGGPAGRVVRASTVDQVQDSLARLADRSPQSLLVLGGGTNVIVADEGFSGTVLHLDGGTIRRIDTTERYSDWVVDAGVVWDDFVAAAVRADCCGVEMMSGIPGRVGAAPVQNVAAYGQQVCDIIESVSAVDRTNLERVEFKAQDCEFGFRTSRFKRDWRDRFVVTQVSFRLPSKDVGSLQPSRYVDLEKYFARTDLCSTDLVDRRTAVLEIRRTKSMLIDHADPMSRSVGSFFVNPSVPVALARSLAQEFKTIGLRVEYLEGHVKAATTRKRVPAAHLLRYSGFNPGDRWGQVGLSERHVLALVTYEGATATDVWNVGHFLRQRVFEATRVLLEFEAFFVGNFPDFDPKLFAASIEYRRAALEEPSWLTGYR